MTRLIAASYLDRHLALASRFFNHADENILKRKALFTYGDHVDSISFQLPAYLACRPVRIFVANDVQAISKQGNSPALGIALEQVGSTLRLVDNEFEQVPGLLGLDTAGRPFG